MTEKDQKTITNLRKLKSFHNGSYGADIDRAIKAIEQDSKTGHWIVDGSVDCYLDKVRCHCSECGKKKEFPADYDHIKHKLSISYKYPEFIDNYCPKCGTKMIESQESEE